MAGEGPCGHRVVLVVSAGLIALVLVSGCGRAKAPSAARSQPGTPSASPSAGPPASSSPSPIASAPAGPQRCHTPNVTAALVTPDAGAGQRYVMIKLTNTSTAACTIFGYGGMQLLDAARHPVPTQLTRIKPPAPTRVSLAPGGSAVSQLHWTAVPGSGEPVAGACEPTPHYAAVTPPDETTPVLVAWTMGPVCQHGAIDQQAYH